MLWQILYCNIQERDCINLKQNRNMEHQGFDNDYILNVITKISSTLTYVIVVYSYLSFV